MRNAPWIGWIQDLSTPDPWFILPVLMAVTMFIQTKLNPTPPDPLQAKMMMWMPLIFSVMFFFFPAGLVLYWVVSNIFSIVAAVGDHARRIEGKPRSSAVRLRMTRANLCDATAPGKGAIGVVRVSGPRADEIRRSSTAVLPARALHAAVATYGPFLGDDGRVIDYGLAMLFPAPHSYTGEDVLELQGHGGPVVMQLLLQRVPARRARQSASAWHGPASSPSAPSSTTRWTWRRPRRWPT